MPSNFGTYSVQTRMMSDAVPGQLKTVKTPNFDKKSARSYTASVQSKDWGRRVLFSFEALEKCLDFCIGACPSAMILHYFFIS